MTGRVVKRFLEHEHEVMFRVLHNGGRCSISTIEPKVLAAAQKLSIEGYLTQGQSWPQAGRTYTPFVLVTERVDMRYLKVHL